MCVCVCVCVCERERERERERYLFVVPLTYWLFLVCDLTGDRTHNLGASGGYSNQLSYPARAEMDL